MSEISRKQLFFGNANALNEYRIHLTKLRWLIPYTRLDEESKLSYNKQLTHPLTYKFLQYKCKKNLVPENTGETDITTGIFKSKVHEITTVFKDTTKEL